MEKMVKVMDMVELPAEELSLILKQGAILRLPYLEGRLLQAKERVSRFEEKYRTTVEALRDEGLPDDAGYELHEDFIEWEYWSDVLHKTGLTVENIKVILARMEESIAVY
jgi:hypothetical protein